MPPDPLAPLVSAIVHMIASVLLPLSLLLAAFRFGLRPILKGAVGEARLARRIARLGFPGLNDVVLRGEDGTLTQVDHVVLTARGLVAIETKNYGGSIYCRREDREWTQVVRGAKIRFQNPIRQNYKHVAALRHHLGPGVSGLVVFAGSARFPNGMPEGVVGLEQFARHMENHGRPSQDQIDGPVWQAACRIAEQGRGLARAHLAQVKGRHGRDPRLAVGVLLTCAALIVLVAGYLMRRNDGPAPGTAIHVVTP